MPEQQLHHLLHLRLLGASIADDGALDLCRRVFGHRQPGLGGGEQGHATRVPELQGAAGVDGVEDGFDRHAVRMAVLEVAAQLRVDDEEAIGKGQAGGGGNGTARDEMMTAAVALDTAPPGADRTGIDPENSHASEASISFSSMSKFDQIFCTSSWSSRASMRRTICWAGFPSSFT